MLVIRTSDSATQPGTGTPPPASAPQTTADPNAPGSSVPSEVDKAYGNAVSKANDTAAAAEQLEVTTAEQ